MAAAPPDPPIRFVTLPQGFAGTVMVVNEMRRLVLEEAPKDERIAQLAREITAHVAPRDSAGETRAVLEWFQTQFRYTRLPYHPEGWQRLQTPAYTLFDAPAKSGECASLTTAMAALLMSLGHEVMFRTAGQDAARPRDFEHIYLLVRIGGEWVAADPSYGESLGWPHRDGDVSPAATWRDWSL